MMFEYIKKNLLEYILRICYTYIIKDFYETKIGEAKELDILYSKFEDR